MKFVVVATALIACASAAPIQGRSINRLSKRGIVDLEVAADVDADQCLDKRVELSPDFGLNIDADVDANVDADLVDKRDGGGLLGISLGVDVDGVPGLVRRSAASSSLGLGRGAASRTGFGLELDLNDRIRLGADLGHDKRQTAIVDVGLDVGTDLGLDKRVELSPGFVLDKDAEFDVKVDTDPRGHNGALYFVDTNLDITRRSATPSRLDLGRGAASTTGFDVEFDIGQGVHLNTGLGHDKRRLIDSGIEIGPDYEACYGIDGDAGDF